MSVGRGNRGNRPGTDGFNRRRADGDLEPHHERCNQPNEAHEVCEWSAARYIDGIDPEVVKLCDALNSLPGVETFESCCGHGRTPFHVWVMVRRMRDLPRLCYWLAACHSGVGGWRVVAQTDCGMSPVTFMVEGPAGDFDGADRIAEVILREGNE